MTLMLRNNEIPKILIKYYNAYVYILNRTMYSTKYLLILTIDLHIRFQMVISYKNNGLCVFPCYYYTQLLFEYALRRLKTEFIERN